MQGESATEAAERAIQPVLEQIREEQRRVIERIRSRDEDGRPRLRLVDEIDQDEADALANRGLF